MNGSFYVDSKLWPYQCNETGGGWGDFFATDNEITEWTADKGKAGGEACLRQKAQQVSELLEKLGTGTEELDGMAARQVNSTSPDLTVYVARSACVLPAI